MKQHYINFAAQVIALLPFLLAFLACMLAMGSYDMDLLSVAVMAAALLSYKPCQMIGERLWKD